MNRRTFIASASAAVLSRRLLAIAATRSIEALKQLDYSQVQLLAGPMLEQFQQQQALYLSLDNDRLMKPFRQLAGMAAPGEDMGGWYTPSKNYDPHGSSDGYIPGHSFGQYVSALSRGYAITSNKATQAKVHSLVSDFAGTISPKFYEGYPLPCYTYEKTLGGLIDAHQFAKDVTALPVLNRATDVALPFFPEKALNRDEMKARPHPNIAFEWDESYTLPENLYLAWQRGAGDRFHMLARKYLQDDTYFGPLAHGENVLPGQHAYSHVNALSSAMQAYLQDGSTMHYDAAQNGFRYVQEQSFATGGWGPGETFRKPGTGALAESLEKQHSSFETPCGAYGHFKIARYLLRVTGDPSYGDSMETVLYNTILGAWPTQQDGTTFYYADYSDGGHKNWYGAKWPCCSGTFAQITADYGISSYFGTADGIAVNLYTPSRVSFRSGSARVQLRQMTEYPRTGDIALTVQSDRAANFGVSLRIPAWSGAATTVRVNGKVQAGVTPGSWHRMTREWRNGDHVEISLDMPLRLQPLDAAHPNLVALVAGPLVLFALEPVPANVSRAQLLAARRVSGGALEWMTQAGSQEEVVLMPFSEINNQNYRLYHAV